MRLKGESKHPFAVILMLAFDLVDAFSMAEDVMASY